MVVFRVFGNNALMGALDFLMKLYGVPAGGFNMQVDINDGVYDGYYHIHWHMPGEWKAAIITFNNLTDMPAVDITEYPGYGDDIEEAARTAKQDGEVTTSSRYMYVKNVKDLCNEYPAQFERCVANLESDGFTVIDSLDGLSLSELRNSLYAIEADGYPDPVFDHHPIEYGMNEYRVEGVTRVDAGDRTIEMRFAVYSDVHDIRGIGAGNNRTTVYLLEDEAANKHYFVNFVEAADLFNLKLDQLRVAEKR